MARQPTIAASEDMDYLYVLADQHAATGQDAVAVLVDQALEQWGQQLDGRKLPRPVALWYREDGDTLQPCAAAEGDSRWWVFANVPTDALELDVDLWAEEATRRLLATLDIFGRLCELSDHIDHGARGGQENLGTLSVVAASPSDPPETL